MSMKSSTPARSAASIDDGSAETPVASTGSAGQSRFRRWCSSLAASAWSPEKSRKMAAGLSRAMRSSSDLTSGDSITTAPSLARASVSHVMWPPLGEAKR
ncbi:hypothetical protein D3C72_2265560 [compost metagenome]